MKRRKPKREKGKDKIGYLTMIFLIVMIVLAFILGSKLGFNSTWFIAPLAIGMIGGIISFIAQEMGYFTEKCPQCGGRLYEQKREERGLFPGVHITTLIFCKNCSYSRTEEAHHSWD